MKIYLIAHEGKPNRFKMEAWARADRVGENGIYVESVNAFFIKKYAKKWIEDRGYNHLEIKSAELN